MEHESDNGRTLGDYIEIIRRRKYYIVIPFLALATATMIVAGRQPNTYRSMGMILIEDQKIPKNMVQTTITDYADARIELIKQRIMTTKTIISIIDKYDLYGDLRDKLTDNEISAQFKEHTEITLFDAAMNPLQGQHNSATIAFTIAFTDPQPDIAQKIATELVTLFLQENIQARTLRARKTTEFLTEETEKLQNQIHIIESSIAEYKQKYGDSLPDMMQINLAMMDRTANDLQRTEGQINVLTDRVAYLTAELTRYRNGTTQTTNEKKQLTEEERIKMLRAEYRDLASRYTSSHPSVQRIKRQLQALNPTFNGAISTEDAHTELEKAKLELKASRDKYAENHPDVIKLKQKMAAFEEQLQTGQREVGDVEIKPATESNDPGYASLQLQLKSSETELESLIKLREQLQTRIEGLRAHMARTPQVERGYFELLRERESNLKKYSDLKGKVMEAKLAQTLEEGQKAESFTLIEPPALPTKPEKGSRKKITIVGLFAAMASGIGLAFLVEAMSSSVRGINALKQITGAYPLVAIPYIENKADMDIKNRQIRFMSLSMASIVLLLALATAYLLHLNKSDSTSRSIWWSAKSSN